MQIHFNFKLNEIDKPEINWNWLGVYRHTIFLLQLLFLLQLQYCYAKSYINRQYSAIYICDEGWFPSGDWNQRHLLSLPIGGFPMSSAASCRNDAVINSENSLSSEYVCCCIVIHDIV